MNKEKSQAKKTLREIIMTTNDIRTDLVVVKEWGNKSFLIRTMNGEERSRFFDLCTDKKGNLDSEKLFIYIIIFTVTDPDNPGELVFLPEDYEKLRKKSGTALDKLSRVAMRLNGLTRDDIKDAEKN
jgi:hypothetical protein